MSNAEQSGASSKLRGSFHSHMGNQNNEISRKLLMFSVSLIGLKTSLYHVLLVRFVGSFVSSDVFTKNFVVKGQKQGVDQSGSRYLFVVSNSYSCLYAA